VSQTITTTDPNSTSREAATPQTSQALHVVEPELDAANEEEVGWMLMDNGVPDHFESARLERFLARPGTDQALAAARAAAADNDRNLILVGPVGTGKTYLAAAVLAEMARRFVRRWPEESYFEPGREITNADGSIHRLAGRTRKRPKFRRRFVVVGSLLADLRRRASGITPTEYRDVDGEAIPDVDPVEQAQEAPFLVLDDLGRERATDFAIETLFRLVDHRYSADLTTLVTTNYRPNELVQRGYDAIVSRLVEVGDVVSLKATDYRLERRP
jgi:DNA replication protein DnaC